MKSLRSCLVAWLALWAMGAQLAAAAEPKPSRVPPPGLSISTSDRADLRERADALAREIGALRNSAHSELLPDVEVFHKAVDWALRYDEFHRSNDTAIARGLLQRGFERAGQLRQGHAPWLSATGLVVRGFVSKIDGSVQPYGLVIPARFARNSRQSWRLDVWLHGRDDKLTELKFISEREKSPGEFAPGDAIVLHPYGRYCNAFKFAGETDVFEAMEHVRSSFRIDEQRIALRGFSMGGAGVWHLAAHYPDKWSVATPGAGFAETAEYTGSLNKERKPPSWEQKLWQLYDATDYAANFFNLPVVAYNGTEDKQRQAADVMERALKSAGLNLPRVWGTNIGHKYTPESKREIETFVRAVMASPREPFPAKTQFTTRSLRYAEAFGVRIDAMDEHWQRADVRTERDGELLHISLTNVAAFTVERPFGQHPARVEVNGQSVALPHTPAIPGQAHLWSASFERMANAKWAPAQPRQGSLRKTHALQGPIDDAFMDSFLIVRPTGAAQNPFTAAWIAARLEKATNDWRAQFRGHAPVVNDTDITEEQIAGNNLVLFGDPKSNRLLARIADRLPVRWNARDIRVGAQSFDAMTHVPVFIFPNPLNPKRYIVVNSGFTFADVLPGSNAQQTPKLPDYAVINVSHGSAVVLGGFFDEQWRLPKD